MRYLSIFLLFLLVNCADEKKIEDYNLMENTLINDINKINKVNIYFGHQSVGYNIIQGMNDIIKEIPNGQLDIIDLDNTRELPPNYFAHSKIGYNREPKTKCDNLILRLNDPILMDVNIVLSKFCYVDFNSDTKVDDLFDYYSAMVADIKKTHPDIIFVHITVPLTTIQTGWKATIKKIMGKELSGMSENIKRNKFNELIRKNYASDPIFDVAKIESTYPDNSRKTFEQGEQIYETLIPEYSYDGGHLNKIGRKIAVRELIKVLADLLE